MRKFEIFARDNRKTDDKISLGFISAPTKRDAVNNVTRNHNGLWISAVEVDLKHNPGTILL